MVPIASPISTRVRELRSEAAICKRVALIPTSGSSTDDQILAVLAQKLERQAALLEGQLCDDTSGLV